MNIDSLTVGEVKQLQSLIGPAKTGAVAKVPPAGRYILVVDRGWIFAGDLTVTVDGAFRLDNAVHVFRWESMGFAKMVDDWKSTKVDLRPVASVEVPKDAVVFRVPVPAGWGLK